MVKTQVKESTGEITVQNPFSLDSLGESLVIPPCTYSIRNNCQLGQWVKSDGVTPLGNKLEMTILNLVPYFGDLGKTKASNWLQVWAISPSVGNNSVVFCTYIKGISLTILGNTVLDCAMEKKSPADVIFHTSFTPRSNEYGSYYTLAFEMDDRPADDPLREKIQLFLATPQQWVDTNLPPTMFPSEGMGVEELLEELQARRTERSS